MSATQVITAVIGDDLIYPMANYFTDLILLAVVTISTAVLLITGVVADSWIRLLLGLPFLLVIPGYAILSAVAPFAGPVSNSTSQPSTSQERDWERRFSGLEWWVVSVAISLLVVPAVVAVLFVLPVEYGTASLSGLLTVVSGGALAVAAVRRSRLPAAQRYHSDPYAWVGNASNLFRTDTPADIVLTLVFVVAVSLLFGSGVYAITASQQGPTHTELSLVTENESGDYVASGYPSTVEPGESIPLTIALENHEREAINYTVVVQEHRLEDDGVVERTELQRIDYVLDDGDTGYGDREFTPAAESGPVRLAVLVYIGDVPETPTLENAYRRAYIWTTIAEDGAVEDSDDESDDEDSEILSVSRLFEDSPHA